MRCHRDTEISVIANQRGRRCARGTVGDVLGLIRQTLGVGGVFQEVHGPGQTVFGQSGGHDPAVEVKDLHVPKHGNRLLLLNDDREQSTVVGRAHHHFAIGEELRRVGTGGPPDHVALDRVELGERLLLAFFGGQHVIDLALGNAVAIERPFHVVDGTLFQRALAGIGFQVEHGADFGRRRVAHQVGAVAEGGRVNDLRDEAIRDHQIAEIVFGRGAVGRNGQVLIGVDLERKAFVAQTDGIRSHNVDQIPGDVAGFVHGAELGHGFGRAFVPDHFEAFICGHIGFGIGTLLRFLIGAAPADERHAVGHVIGKGCRHDQGGRCHQCRKGFECHRSLLVSTSSLIPGLAPGHWDCMGCAAQASSARQSSGNQPISICCPGCRRT